ncbi:tRNA lysidine(34) synthetase TilS [Pelagerythrobacter marensis]|uniref:tRNA lysidine(34) synthetase TilS n=1 Tax=Pelagerythrobacter marensis TaxID=543877 RepID=UPI003CC8AF2F
MLLAHRALPGRVEAATVDHGLRPESAAEAAMVADVCRELGVRHATLPVSLDRGNVQGQARAARYSALTGWLGERSLDALATAHHADDQAETLLMRLNRGSGLPGLAGIRSATLLPDRTHFVVRPLLEWRRAELAALVEAAGLEAADDPSNRDPAYDRARIRQAIEEADWLDPVAIATSARLLAEAEEAIEAMLAHEFQVAVATEDGCVRYRPGGPRLIRHLAVERIFGMFAKHPRGSRIAALVSALEGGGKGNLAGILARAEGDCWIFSEEPARRSG